MVCSIFVCFFIYFYACIFTFTYLIDLFEMVFICVLCMLFSVIRQRKQVRFSEVNSDPDSYDDEVDLFHKQKDKVSCAFVLCMMVCLLLVTMLLLFDNRYPSMQQSVCCC